LTSMLLQHKSCSSRMYNIFSISIQ
jgi:hypothetical protein